MILRRFASFSIFLLVLPFAVFFSGCSSLKQLTIVPGSGATVLNVGQTAQFTAVGVSQMGSGSPTTSNNTNSVTWSVTNPSVASINASGLATALSAGYTQIIAESGGVIATSDITVNAASSTGSGSGKPYLSIIPNATTDTFIGETTQFFASGSLSGGTASNLTSQVQWLSSNVQVATVSSGGLVTAVGAGTTTITAYSAGLTASATLTVQISGNVNTATLSIIPTTATATFKGETTQFIAIGNLTGSGTITNLTNNVSWSSSDVSVATINQAGLATAQVINQQENSTTITAIGTTSNGSLITATATLTALPSTTINPVSLPTLAVYMTGPGTGTVTSSPGAVSCGSSTSGASCTNSFTLGTTVTLTAAPASGSSFGGWSSNCAPVNGNPLQCTVTMTNNETVGAAFN